MMDVEVNVDILGDLFWREAEIESFNWRTIQKIQRISADHHSTSLSTAALQRGTLELFQACTPTSP